MQFNYFSDSNFHYIFFPFYKLYSILKKQPVSSFYKYLGASRVRRPQKLLRVWIQIAGNWREVCECCLNVKQFFFHWAQKTCCFTLMFNCVQLTQSASGSIRRYHPENEVLFKRYVTSIFHIFKYEKWGFKGHTLIQNPYVKRVKKSVSHLNFYKSLILCKTP